jgi:hypothetical protein
MKTYDVEVEWSGYSRGYSVYRVTARSEKEAKNEWYNGERIAHGVVRDDTDAEVGDVSIVLDVSPKES